MQGKGRERRGLGGLGRRRRRRPRAREARAKLRGGGRCERSEHASASEASALARESLPHFHMRRTNTWHFLQQSGQFLRLSGRPPLRYGLGPTASKIVHFVEGNAMCWSDACEKKNAFLLSRARFARTSALASLVLARSLRPLYTELSGRI